MDFGQQKWDIVTCESAFLFIPRRDFDSVFGKCIGAIKPGGIFAFDLFECYFSKDEIASKIKDNKFVFNGIEMKILWNQYYKESTSIVLKKSEDSAGDPVFEYWEFVCQV